METLICLAIIIMALYLFKLPQRYPYIYFSSLTLIGKKIDHMEVETNRKFYLLGLILFALAWADFHFETSWQDNLLPPKVLPTEGIALYVALDRSGSMKDYIEATIDDKDAAPIRKIDFLKIVTKDFILNNSLEGDMIGLVAFARTANILSPLTLDHDLLVKQLDKIQAVENPQDDGTAIGYAVEKIVNLIAATKEFGHNLYKQKKIGYEIKGAAIIMVTDGFQTINHADINNSRRTIDIEQAAADAAKEKIKLYIISIDPDFKNENYQLKREVMDRAAAITGGAHYVANHISNLKNIYQEIQKIEKSSFLEPLQQKNIPQQEKIRSFSFFPLFIFAGLISISFGFLYETRWQRRVP